MRADLTQVRADLASATKERDAYRKANLKFKEAEAKAQQLKEKEDMVKRGLEEEVDGLRRQVKELELENDWAKLGPDAAVSLEEAKAEDEDGLDKVLATSQGLPVDDVDKRAAAEDEPKPTELISAGFVVTPPEGVPAAALSVAQTSQGPPAVDEKDSSSPAAP
ncbi:uncharacterized protein LOC108203502 [Daucus carota subsp. sativus]|uniref:uncharacterized protein LOC108203502 n=1 Tax=Daucus carota subsp. sativus TaxID=79200 RepID=UPI0007F01D0D|nr:PREDICTED: uncharacterized protein LOC108203502 [Daucus carota subsp. sativus]